MKLPRAKSKGCETLRLHMKAEGIGYTPEFKFHPVRKWRFDFALAKGIAVEVEGGLWILGRHNRGLGMEEDMAKYNEAALQGWRVLRFSTAMVKNGKAIETIKRALS